MPEVLRKSSKTGSKFTAISDLQNNEERDYILRVASCQLRVGFYSYFASCELRVASCELRVASCELRVGFPSYQFILLLFF